VHAFLNTSALLGGNPVGTARPDRIIHSSLALSPNTRIGVYEVTEQIGAGGMGEVYRASDSNLKRSVAIKVLPAAVASDADRLARFQREAEVLAALNHPNIGAIYGLEKTPDFTALVMELVEGEDLSQRIARGAIPLDEALPIARQIAEALETAHERGIVHRDLKPANIKVREDGTVKVLDFGIAKALSPDGPGESPDAMNSPTLTAHATQLGVILGTAAYMAPEQAKGKPVDRRADIWAFGVVLYEMLAGRRAYEAEDVSDTLAAVLTREVDWKALPQAVPPRLHALLRDCLVRDPKQRLRDIGDARRVLDQIISGAPDPTAAIALARLDPRPGTRVRLPWVIAALALGGAGALGFVHFGETVPIRHSVRFQVRAPEKSDFGAFSLSPDGRYLAFSTAALGTAFGVQGIAKVWVRPIDSLDARALPGTDGARPGQDQLFWSPDGAFIGFVAQDAKLRKISVNGGPPQALASVSPITRATWGPNGVILLGGLAGSPIQRLPDSGGIPVDVTKKLDGQTQFQPQFLPDGQHFLYNIQGSNPEANGIYVDSLEGGTQPKRILPDSSVAKYVPPDVPGRTGHLLFVRETTLMAQPFDAERLALTGEMFPIAESAGRFSVSQNGALAYMTGDPASIRQELLWIDRSGKQINIVGAPMEFRSFRLSPDEKSAVFDRIEDRNSDIWVLDLARGVPTRITFDSSTDNLPIWSHDGRRILWPSRRSGPFDLYIKAASGTGQDEKFIAMGTATGWGTDWSRDGKFVLYQRPGDKTGQDLWIAPQANEPVGNTQKPFPYLQSPFNEANGVFSPDGRWIAYESDESGRAEVYVQAFPLTSEKVRISTGGGTAAAWSKNDAELFYLAENRNLMAVPYRTRAGTLEPGVAKVLFSIPGNGIRRTYAPSADGRRFLIARPLDENTSEPVTVVLNWQTVVKK
jgi:eukaryotic-like serine/threonine-protein kinase